MKLPRYLPSGHFATIAGSIAIAGGLVVLAQFVTAPRQSAVAGVVATQTDTDTQDWRTALDAVQATAPSLPPAPSPDTTKTLLGAAQSSNVTDTVARSLLVNLSDATSQGLGADTPTQSTLVQTALSQLPAAAPIKAYTAANLTIVADSKGASHAYGNAVMAAFSKHQGATSAAVLSAVSQALDGGTAQDLDALPGIAANYALLASDLAKVPVPRTLEPFHLQVINDVSTLAATLQDARYVISDPLRGLQGLQQYQLKLGEIAGVLTAVAQSFNKDGILFTKDEPGVAWAVFVAAPGT